MSWSLYDGKPVPKVIGSAWPGDRAKLAGGLCSQYGTMVGTLEYAGGTGGDSSSWRRYARDIYSLGVLLYELLTDGAPLARRVKRHAPNFSALSRRKSRPNRARVWATRGSLPSISAQRNMEPAKLTKLVRELDGS